MVKQLCFWVAFCVCLVLVLMPAYIQAQEDYAEYVFGTVDSVSSGQITVTTYDFDTDEEIKMVFTAGDDIELEGVEKISDLSQGDGVDIEYSVVDGKNVAVYIGAEKMTGEYDGEDSMY